MIVVTTPYGTAVVVDADGSVAAPDVATIE